MLACHGFMPMACDLWIGLKNHIVAVRIECTPFNLRTRPKSVCLPQSTSIYPSNPPSGGWFCTPFTTDKSIQQNEQFCPDLMRQSSGSSILITIQNDVGNFNMVVVWIPTEWEIPRARNKYTRMPSWAIFIYMGWLVRGLTIEHEHIFMGREPGYAEYVLIYKRLAVSCLLSLYRYKWMQ